MTFEELLQLAKDTPIIQEQVDELRKLLIEKAEEGERQERLNYSTELMNRTYNL